MEIDTKEVYWIKKMKPNMNQLHNNLENRKTRIYRELLAKKNVDKNNVEEKYNTQLELFNDLF